MNDGNSAALDERVVREIAREQVAGLVVDDFFEQRLCRPLCDAAVDLSIGEQRIDDRAAVVDRRVIDQRDVTRVAIDLDDRHMRAEGKGRVGSLPIDLDEQSRAQTIVLASPAVQRGRRPGPT